MVFKFIVFIVFAGSLTPLCNGLEAGLTADDYSEGCHLVCKASYPMTLDRDMRTTWQDENASPFSTVTSLKLLKTVGKIETEGILLTFLNYQRPNVQIETDSIVIKGSLDVQEALFQAHIKSDAACKSKYICRAEGVDIEGRDLVSIKTVTLQSEKQENVEKEVPLQDAGSESEERDLKSSILVQVLALLHRLDKNVELLAQSVDAFEDKFEGLEKTVGFEMKTMEYAFRDEFNSLEQKLGDLKTQLGASGLETGRSPHDNVCKIEVRLSKEGGMQEGVDVTDSLEQLRQEIQAYRNSTLEAEGSAIFDTSDLMMLLKNSTDTLIASLDEKLPPPVPQVSDLVGPLFENLTHTIADALAITQAADTSIAKNLTCEPSAEFLTSLSSELLPIIHDSLGSFVRASVQSIVAPWLCQKGMLPAIAQSPFPYPLVYNTSLYEYDFPMLCDSVTDGGGWVIIQRRTNGNVDFNRDWNDYKVGFGTYDGDFWLGNDRINQLTSGQNVELRIDIRHKFKARYATYKKFYIGGENQNYKLFVEGYSGTAGDDLAYHNNMPFSTKDRDNDLKGNENCAKDHGGGWWFNKCDDSNLNGNWGIDSDLGVEWTAVAKWKSLTFTEMKIRQSRA